jgi:thioester reductase-like protein
LLHELLVQTKAPFIYCLVRPESGAEGSSTSSVGRLRAHFIRALGASDEMMRLLGYDERVFVLEGDLGEQLGLSPERYTELTHSIDEIVHAGALVNWVKDYSVMREPNVIGTREILRLAGNGKIKPVTFVSTISIAGLHETDILSSANAIQAGPYCLWARYFFMYFLFVNLPTLFPHSDQQVGWRALGAACGG